ncbi:hypothetical protein MKK49_19535, partial [Methylobacterium sp. J-090]|nr:hypothetical protein [Methylobacterium sp. J-090]
MRVLPLALCTALAVSGCSSILPGAGPTTGAIVAGADVSTSEGTVARYEIVDLPPAPVAALRGRPRDILLASSGEHRPSLAPFIGAAAFVTVSGEAVSGARVPLSGKGDRLLDVVATAGGVKAPVNETFVRLSRGNLTATVPLTTIV